MNDDREEMRASTQVVNPAKVNAIPFSLVQQIEFTLKELRETLRDRRTIVTLLAMPLLLYPLLGLGLRFMAFQQSPDRPAEYQIAVETPAEAEWLLAALKTGERILAESRPKNGSPVKEPKIEFFPVHGSSIESLVTGSSSGVGVRIQFPKTDSADAAIHTTSQVQLFQNENSATSRDAADYIEERLAALNTEMIKQWAAKAGIAFQTPVMQERVLLKPAESGSGVIGLLPLILLLMTVTGGVYPAIDLTAGERERNTLEILMALPVPRFRLLLAKYIAVVSVTMLTGLMNLLAMSVTLYALQLDKTLLGNNGFTIGLGIKLFLALTAFALFYSAVLLLLTSSAKSFKEAQAYLIPLLLLSIAPGMLILIPGWELSGGTAAIPLVNMLLLSRELLQGTVAPLPAVVAIVSTVLYAIAALTLAGQVFGNDAIAVGSRGGWKDLLKRPVTGSSRVSIAAAFLGLAILFPAYFVVSGILSRGQAQPVERLVISALMTIVLFVGLPSLLMKWQRVSFADGLGIKRPSVLFLISAVLFGLATWPWIFELVVLAQNIGIRGLDLSKVEKVESLLEGWKSVPLWIVVVCLGVVPGICEEYFFRGYFLNGLRQHLNAAGSITISAIAFGLFHVVLAGGAAPERLLPSTLMGLLLGWMAWHSGSLLPSMLLHVIHNSTLLVMVQSRDLLAQWNIGQMEQTHLPGIWLAASCAVLIVGYAIAHFARTKPVKPQQPKEMLS